MGTTLGKYLMLGALLMADSLQAQFTYSNNFNSITITGYDGPGGDITIPDTINGLPVTSIAGGAFRSKDNINSITIPDSVTAIGRAAFSSCLSLFGVVLPRRLANIEDSTFYGCTQLTGITIPESVTNIGANAFIHCAGISELRIPDSVRRIGNHAFDLCWRLTNATIGHGVEIIGDYAFARAGLVALDAGRSVRSIGNYAFSHCTNLLSATVPASVTNLGSSAFYYCSQLRSVYFAGNAPSANDPFLISYQVRSYYLPGTTGWGSSFGGRPAISWNPRMEVRGTGLISITGHTNLPVVLEACTNLANPVWLPVGTNTLLGGRALCSDPANFPTRFYRLTPPSAVPYDFTITNGAAVITKYVGPGGSLLIPGTINGLPVRGIGQIAFAYRPDLKEIKLPDSVTEIDHGAFASCTTLTNVTLSRNLTRIAGDAFYNCGLLRSINIPAGVTNIDPQAFQYCYELTAIHVDPANAVYSSSLGGVVFDKNRTTLVAYPFGKVGSYTVPNSVTNIGASAFYYCHRLTNITIPNGLTRIGDDAFNGCIGLTRITLPGNLRRIGKYAFYYTGITNVILPNNLAFLGEHAFAYCHSLTNVAFGNILTAIQRSTFEYCDGLSSVTLPDSVTSIGVSAFDSCYGLTNITFGRNLASIAERAFSGCHLKRVSLPGMVTNISSTAFDQCAALASINVNASNLVYSSTGGVLFNKARTALLLCPAGKGGTYTIPDGVTRIGEYAFASSALTNVVIAPTVTDIRAYAFYESNLKSATIPDSVATLGSAAFASCPRLANVTVGNGVTELGDSVFGYCWDLTALLFKGNAPAADNNFLHNGAAIVYYVAGTTGWGPTFAGRPTAPWSP